MLRMRLRNLGFSQVSFGSFWAVIFKSQCWFIVARFWLKNYGLILPRFTVLIFVRVPANVLFVTDSIFQLVS